MSFLMEIVFPLFFLFLMLGALVTAGCAFWHLLPGAGGETLQRALQRVSGHPASRRSGPPVYAVQVDGQLLYASGLEDGQTYLCTTMVTASRQVLRVVDSNQPATLVFTCGTESVVIEVHRA